MKTIQLRTMWVTAFAIMTISAMAQNAGDFVVPFSDPGKRGKVKVHLNYGGITVRGTARKDVLVKYKGTGEQDKEAKESRDGLKKISGGTLDLEATENNNLIYVGSGSWNNKINLEVEVPSGVDLRVEAYNDGDIFIYNVQGEVEIKNYNGEITADGISGSVVASTYNGDIKIGFDKVTPNTPMSYSTYNGDIDLSFPADFKASFKMKTEQGEIFSGFDMNLVKSGPIQKKEERSGTYKVIIDDWVKGDINGGGAEISMKSYNGDIKIRKK